MGYTTYFDGAFDISPALDAEMVDYLNKFASTRRMKRDVETIKRIFPDYEDNCLGGELGIEGEYFVGGLGSYGQGDDDSILNYNEPPSTQPGLWCQWVPSADGSQLRWDEGEKFYCYVEWLEYIIANFMAPYGYVLNGEVYWDGEESDDLGIIVVSDNDVNLRYGRVEYD